jgi:hypothetical protein
VKPRCVQWLTVGGTIPNIATLREAMLGLAYSTKRSRGFRIDDYNNDWLRATHIERRHLVEATTGPFGEAVENERTWFEEVTFVIFPKLELLEVSDAPRRTKPFLAQLSQATDFRMSIAQMEVDVRRWIESVKNTLGPLTSTSAVIDQVRVSKSASACVEVRTQSSTGLHDKDLTRFARVGSVVVRMRCFRESGERITFGRRCCAWVERKHDPTVARKLRDGLLVALDR